MQSLMNVMKITRNSLIFHLNSVRTLSNLVAPNFQNGILSASNVQTSHDKQFVVINVEKPNNKSEQYKYPSVWLRDNCQCSSCFHAGAKSRTIDWSKFNVNVKPKSVSVSSLALFFLIKQCGIYNH